MTRRDGYAPLRDYGVIGDGRTVALVARDGSIDWLCLPDLDSPSVFAAVLDAVDGGCFRLAPGEPFEVERRYVPETNVLETTFVTGQGTVRVTDAMLLPRPGLAPALELARRVDCLSGQVRMQWAIEPRFDYGRRQGTIGNRADVPVVTSGSLALALRSWDAGAPRCESGSIAGAVELSAGESSLLVLAAAHQEPLVLPTRLEVEARLEATRAFWRSWARDRAYEGPWRDAVLRCALALKLLFHTPSGAIAAAGTTSLPEQIGGGRNWDYRFCWVRDAAFTLEAMLKLSCPHEADAFFWWLLHTSQLTHPRLQVLYGLDGGVGGAEETLALAGYRGSRPVRIGNGAVEQTQLDIYGDYLQTAWLYQRAGGSIDTDTGRRLAEIAELVCRIWREPDSGIWEVRSQPVHFTQSKMMCWVALDRAARLADDGLIPSSGIDRWRAEAAAIRAFVERQGWSERLTSYTRFAGSDELDASLLLAAVMDYDAPVERLDHHHCDPPRTRPRTVAVPLQRRGRPRRTRRVFRVLLFLARAGARSRRPSRSSRRTDGRADRSRQRPWALCRGDRAQHGRVPGKPAPGPRGSRVDQFRQCDRGGTAMNIWGAVAGRFVGTLVLTTTLRAASELGLTRIDLPFLLGTAFTADRGRAKALGYLLHFLAGQIFALIYFALFSAIHTSGFALGALFGLVHGLFAGTALVNILLPVVIRGWGRR